MFYNENRQKSCINIKHVQYGKNKTILSKIPGLNVKRIGRRYIEERYNADGFKCKVKSLDNVSRETMK